MVIKDIIISNTEPPKNHRFWGKPINGGIGLYILEGGKWLPVKQMKDMGTPTTDDDAPGGSAVCDVVGKTLVFQE